MAVSMVKNNGAARRTVWHLDFADGHSMSIYDRTIVGRLARERDVTAITQVLAEWTGDWDEGNRRVEYISKDFFTRNQIEHVIREW